MKAYSLERFGAFIIDVLLVSFIISIFNIAVPYNNTYKEASKKNTEYSEKYLNGEISNEKYLESTFENQYKMAKNSMVQEAIGLIITIGYFVTFQFMKNGQTLGKKVLKIKIKKKDGSELSAKDLLIREFIIQGMLITIVTLICLLIFPKSAFKYYYYIASFIVFATVLASIIMILFRKDGRGLHDLVANTEVIRLEEKIIKEAEIIEERSEENERINRTGNSKKRKD